MFGEAFRKCRCIAPMNVFYQKDSSGRRYVVSRVDGQAPREVALVWHDVSGR